MNGWKVTAIILMIVLALVLAFFYWSYTIAVDEEEKTMNCYYDICSEYPEAFYDVTDKVCSCYDYDVMGELKVTKNKYLG